MRPLVPAVAIAGILAGVLAGSAVAALPAPGRTPQATLAAQNAAYNAKQWRALYATYTPKFRTACSYVKWMTSAVEFRTKVGPFTLRVTSARISGSKAYLKYEYVQNGKVIASVGKATDTYVRINGRWYDELDAITTC